MKLPKLMLTNDGNLGMEMDLNNMGYFNVTPKLVREIVLGNWIVSGPGVDQKFMPTSDELEAMLTMAQFAVNRGQMIDFGYWPNDMIREVGTRGGTLYCQNALGHPFSTPYIIIHTWDDPKLPISQAIAKGEYAEYEFTKLEKHACAYLINPFPKDKELLIDFEVVAFEGIQIPRHGGQKCLGVGDRAVLDAAHSRESGFYAAQVVPYAFRWGSVLNDPEFLKLATNRNDDDILHAACGNVLDPVMVALMLLNTRGVRQQTIAVNPKLNKARIKSNKPPIPPYRQVDSASYVTAILNRVRRSPGPGTGTHASPVMHVRQGHWRHYQTGEKSFIRDTLVNATPEMREQYLTQQTGQVGRSHYVVKDQ